MALVPFAGGIAADLRDLHGTFARGSTLDVYHFALNRSGQCFGRGGINLAGGPQPSWAGASAVAVTANVNRVDVDTPNVQANAPTSPRKIPHHGTERDPERDVLPPSRD
ncbi:MAG: hypothetical protein IPQ07_45680 [Myxococcales bacterium]|nr:hypothetical protein [Myxococcales bacterium]